MSWPLDLDAEGDGHVLPSPEQESVVRAAIAPGDECIAAFRRWRASVDVEQPFDWQMARLLPRVYTRLFNVGYDDPLMPRLKGTYRRAWVEGQRHAQRTRDILALLATEGIDVMLLKGLALGLHYYGNVALRPMGDIDLAVRARHAPRAIALLRSHGWTGGGELTPQRFAWFHAQQLFHSDGGELDLHWRILVESSTTADEDALWKHAEPIEINGHRAFVLDPTAQLFHTVVHGMRWNNASPMRWIVDAAEVLHATRDRIDWIRYLSLARQMHVTLRTRIGLELLARRYGLEIPHEILTELARARPSSRERLEARVILADQRHWGTRYWYNYWSLFGDFVRVAEHTMSWPALLWTFPSYLCFRMGLSSRRELLAIASRGLRRRLLVQPPSSSSVTPVGA